MIAGSFHFSTRTALGPYLAYVFVLCLLLFGVCWVKGEPLRWRWGKKDPPTDTVGVPLRQ